jgi:hypothetical protein
MTKLTMNEIEDVMRVFQQVQRDHGLREHEIELLQKLETMRCEAWDTEVLSRH